MRRSSPVEQAPRSVKADVEAVKSDLKGRKAVKLIVDNAKPVEKEKEKKAAKKAAKKEDEAAEAPAEEAPKAEE